MAPPSQRPRLMRPRSIVALASGLLLLASSGTARADGMQSPGAFATGVGLSSLGVAGLAIGGTMFSSGAGACDALPRDAMPSDTQIDACRAGVNQQVGGVIGLVTGGAFLLGGLPLLVVGAVPAGDDAGRAAVQVGVTPTSVELSLSF